mmetsp:Transcript_28160/g.73812  ORF Transcript_28160/g.73812 Transcript_28160/m.73812 type:complete len:554 (-) Transcript_28160:174-1835(-)
MPGLQIALTLWTAVGVLEGSAVAGPAGWPAVDGSRPDRPTRTKVASSGPEAQEAPAPTKKGPLSVKPHIIFVLQDDLGYFDNAFMGNDRRAHVSGNISRMANEGIILTQHYVFYWCSPTRRSFLTGRLPVHHGEMLSDITDDIDLRWSIISQKLQPAGYKSYWFGKGHTGYLSMNHLPTRRGFLNFTGFLTGMQSYTSPQRWQNEVPLPTTEYSTTLYGNAVLQMLEDHDPADPLFLYLPWQAVHEPYTAPDSWPKLFSKYEGMLWDTDCYAGLMRDILEAKDMWPNLLWVYSADNGGRGDGINWPLRGEKRTNYEGGMRASAFVSGGVVPLRLRGTKSNIRFHIVDWYATLCYLAAVDPSDDSPVAPLPIDPVRPAKDIYGKRSWPGVDGVVIWDMLMNPSRYNETAAHPTLVLSHEVILVGNMKLMTAQRGDTHQNFDKFENLWQDQRGKWFSPPGWNQTCGFPVYGIAGAQFKPCLFDLSVDLNETTDVGARHPLLLHEMWTLLNRTWLTYFHARSPPELLGLCNKDCAAGYWNALGGTPGPQCGIPGCW